MGETPTREISVALRMARDSLVRREKVLRVVGRMDTDVA